MMYLRRIMFLSIPFFMGVLVCACSPTHISSNKLKLEKFHGKWVFINYWASWCESCQLEIPELNAFAKKYPKRVVFLGVNYDGLQGAALKEAILKSHITFTVLSKDPASCLKLAPVTVVPTTVVFNPNGNLSNTLVGPQSQISLEQIIK